MPAPSPRISFAPPTPNNLGTVRKLNSVLFPIKYSEKFYESIQKPELEDFCKLGAWRVLSAQYTITDPPDHSILQ